MTRVEPIRNLTIPVPCLRGGGGVHPDFFVKLDFKIAVDQQTKAHDRIFEGVKDFRCPPVPAGQPRPYLVNFLLPNHLNMLKTMLWGALLVASVLLNSYIKFHQDWTKNGRVISQKPYAHIWAYASNLIL